MRNHWAAIQSHDPKSDGNGAWETNTLCVRKVHVEYVGHKYMEIIETNMHQVSGGGILTRLLTWACHGRRAQLRAARLEQVLLIFWYVLRVSCLGRMLTWELETSQCKPHLAPKCGTVYSGVGEGVCAAMIKLLKLHYQQKTSIDIIIGMDMHGPLNTALMTFKGGWQNHLHSSKLRQSNSKHEQVIAFSPPAPAQRKHNWT